MLSRFFLTFGADTLKNDIVAGEYKSMGILDRFFQAGHIFHVHIKNTATFDTPRMIMVMAKMVKTVGLAGDFPLSDLPRFAKPLQIPIHRPPADMGMILFNFLIYLVRSSMTLQFIDSFQNQSTLNGIASDHQANP